MSFLYISRPDSYKCHLPEPKSLISVSSSSSLYVACSLVGRFSLWNISSRESEDESWEISFASCVCRKGRNFLDPMFALKFSKPNFIVRHVEDNPEDGTSVPLTESELPAFNNDTLADDTVLLSTVFELDVSLLCSLMVVYLWLIASLFSLY
uniref:Uncharacterized protein n=1 Tax=Opuntia streptacantha TaxID=393608 RepID=A0A7C9AJ75_OPUST